MTDFGIWTKNVDIQAKAGTNANATSKATAATDVYVLEIESLVNCLTRRNWSDDYSGLNADVKGILKLITSNMCAIIVIQWDMSGFTSRIEAEDMINVLRDQYLLGLSVLRDKKTETFIDEAT